MLRAEFFEISFQVLLQVKSDCLPTMLVTHAFFESSATMIARSEFMESSSTRRGLLRRSTKDHSIHTEIKQLCSIIL